MPLAIIQAAANAMIGVLGDASAGFNVQLASYWNQYGISGEPWQIKWSPDGSDTFLLSRLGILDLYEDEQYQLPAATLFEGGDASVDEVVTSTFGGPMLWIVEHHVAVPSGSLRQFHRIRYAVHDAMFACFNGSTPQPYFLAAGIRYSGRLSMAEPPPIISPTDASGADLGDLLQTLSFRIETNLVV